MNKNGYTTIKMPQEMIDELYMLRIHKEFRKDSLGGLIRKMVRLGLDQTKAKDK